MRTNNSHSSTIDLVHWFEGGKCWRFWKTIAILVLLTADGSEIWLYSNWPISMEIVPFYIRFHVSPILSIIFEVVLVWTLSLAFLWWLFLVLGKDDMKHRITQLAVQYHYFQKETGLYNPRLGSGAEKCIHSIIRWPLSHWCSVCSVICHGPFAWTDGSWSATKHQGVKRFNQIDGNEQICHYFQYNWMNIDGFWLDFTLQILDKSKKNHVFGGRRQAPFSKNPQKGRVGNFPPKKWEGADCRSMVFHDFPFGCHLSLKR